MNSKALSLNQVSERLSLPDLAWQSCRRHLESLPRYATAALISWFFSFILPLAVPRDIRPLMSGGLFCCFHSFYAASASLAADRWNKTFIGLSFQRASGHSITLLAFFLGLFLLIGLVLVTGLIAGARTNDVLFYATGAGIIAVVFFCMLRFWPVFITLFLYDGSHRWTPSKGGVFWDGPSFGTAWRMTGLPGGLGRSFWLLAGCFMVFTPNLLILQWLESLQLAHYFSVIYFYVFAVPLVTQMAYDMGETLLVRTKYDRFKAEPERAEASQDEDKKYARELYEKTGIRTMFIPPEALDPSQTGPSRWQLVKKHFMSLRTSRPFTDEHYLAFIQDFDDLVNRQSALRLIGFGRDPETVEDDVVNSGQRHPGFTIRLLSKKLEVRRGNLGRLAQTLDEFELRPGDYVLLAHAPTKHTFERVVIKAVVEGKGEGTCERARAILASLQDFSLMGQVLYIGDSEHPICSRLLKKKGESILTSE